MEKLAAIIGLCGFATILSFPFCLEIFNLKNKEDICGVNDYMLSLISYLQHNGRTEFIEELPRKCAKLLSEKDLVSSLKNTLAEFLQNCKPRVYDRSFRKEFNYPIVTLFTSCDKVIDKHDIINRTISNWDLLKPEVNIVLFTNDTVVKGYVVEKGWAVFPIMHHVSGLPVLRTMFETVKDYFNTTFYGFVRYDILFNHMFLESILVVYKAFPTYENILLTGKGTHVPLLTTTEVISYDSLTKAATQRGQLSNMSSVNYLLSNYYFDWNEISDFTVGNPGSINGVVAHARCSGVKVIDITNTVLAVEQRIVEENVNSLEFSSESLLQNSDFMSKATSPQTLRRGYIVCPEWRSYITLCGDVEIAQRTYNPPFCDCF